VNKKISVLKDRERISKITLCIIHYRGMRNRKHRRTSRGCKLQSSTSVR